MIDHKVNTSLQIGAGLDMNVNLNSSVEPKTQYHVECYDAQGNLKWVEDFPNIVVTAGKNKLIDEAFNGVGYTASWFVGLKDAGTPVAADTMASHASWLSITPYSNASDPALVLPAAANGTANNSASKAVFNINAPDDVYGAFLKTSSIKGGAIGTLYGVGDFSAMRPVQIGDTLNVTCGITMA